MSGGFSQPRNIEPAECATMVPSGRTPQQLILENQGLVRSLAQRIRRGLPDHVEMDDLVAYGQQGLAEAAANYDPARGGQFSTYAYYRIRGAIYDGLSKMNWFSRAQYQQARNQQLAGEVLALEADEAPEGAARMEDEVRWLKQTTGKLAVVYLMTQVGDDERDTAALADPSTPTPAQDASRHEIAQRLAELIDQLPDEAAALIRGVYYDGLTLQEAGQRIGVSKAWACRLHARTLERLARSLRRSGVTDAE
jgi:RNA polymerase sigma factor FliA